MNYRKSNIPIASLIAIYFLLSLNAIFNSLSFALGLEPFQNTFLISPADLFGDFFKAIFSYSLNNQIDTSAFGFKALGSLLNEYLNNNPYKTIDPNTGLPLNLHAMPLSMVYALSNLKLMEIINPFNLFLVEILLIVMLYYFSTSLITSSIIQRLIFLLITLLSYPFLFLIVRGHFISALTTLFIIIYILFLHRNKINIALFFLAICCNFRPNCIILFPILIICFNDNYLKNLFISSIKFLIFSLFIFYFCLILANNIYPLYNFSNLISGLGGYHSRYAMDLNGTAYGSSLLGALKLMFGYSRNFENSIFLSSFLILIASLIFYKNKVLNKASLIFLMCALYCLTTSVFADYYLGVFIVPIIYQYIESNRNDKINLINLLEIIICLLLLGPKNYIYNFSGISYQVVLNPLILLFGVILVFALSVFYFLKLKNKSLYAK